MKMKPCKFTFDDTPAFDGFSHESKWNGFDNVAVTQETRETIACYFARFDYETADYIREIKPMENGLISFGWGFATTIERE
jgi:hypothetical protein